MGPGLKNKWNNFFGHVKLVCDRDIPELPGLRTSGALNQHVEYVVTRVFGKLQACLTPEEADQVIELLVLDLECPHFRHMYQLGPMKRPTLPGPILPIQKKTED
jgi:hypothetical protein